MWHHWMNEENRDEDISSSILYGQYRSYKNRDGWIAMDNQMYSQGTSIHSTLNAKWQPITSNSLLAQICILLEVFPATSKREIVM